MGWVGASSLSGEVGGGGWRPRPRASGHGLVLLAVGVEDPGLDALDGLGVGLGGAEVVEVAAFRSGAEGARGEGHVEVALGAAPEGEAGELGAGEGTVLLVEDDLGLGDEAVGAVLRGVNCTRMGFAP